MTPPTPEQGEGAEARVKDPYRAADRLEVIAAKKDWQVSILLYGHLVEVVIDRGVVGDAKVPSRGCMVGQGETIEEAAVSALGLWNERHAQRGEEL